jgi:hypothetical protein
MDAEPLPPVGRSAVQVNRALSSGRGIEDKSTLEQRVMREITTELTGERAYITKGQSTIASSPIMQ